MTGQKSESSRERKGECNQRSLGDCCFTGMESSRINWWDFEWKGVSDVCDHLVVLCPEIHGQGCFYKFITRRGCALMFASEERTD